MLILEQLIFSYKMASYLYKRGFKIKYTRNNLKNSHLVVFAFEDSPELQQAMTDFTNIQREGK